MKKIPLLLLLGAFLTSFVPTLKAQSDTTSLLDLLDEDNGPGLEFVKAAFKTNRVINMHSVENTAPGVLDVKISHRFGNIKQGLYDIFGLDVAQMRIGYDLGLTDRLVIGGGRSNFEKVFDGYVKYKFIRQQSGRRVIPVTVAGVVGMGIRTSKNINPALDDYFWDRAYYQYQLLIGSKISEGFSVQLVPTLLHRNLVTSASEANDVYALGMGARQKISKRVAINLEYIHVFKDQLAEQFVNSLSLGLDIETGGHVFQLHFTNSQGMNERAFITETTDTWKDLQIHFGFNMSRVFTLWDRKMQ